MSKIRQKHEPKTALIAGATGLVGGHCLELLLEDKAYDRIIALVRRPLGIGHAKLSELVVDFERLDDYSDRLTCDDLFCCLGTTIAVAKSQEAFRRVDHDYPVKLATLARANGCDQFLLVSSIGANPSSSVFYSRVKGEVEKDISRLDFSAIHIFRPSLLLGERREVRLKEQIAESIASVLQFMFVGPLRQYKPIEASGVAAAMVEVAKQNRDGIHIYESEQIQKIALDAVGKG
jgi:uncharacterized protein YbjT (DUF2867 family)